MIVAVVGEAGIVGTMTGTGVIDMVQVVDMAVVEAVEVELDTLAFVA